LTGQFAIVPLTEDHVPACSALEARAFNRLRRAWGQAAQPERRQDCLAQYLRLFPEGACGALADGRIVGFCISHSWGTLGWIGPIAVEPEWQGRGIGRELTQWVLQALNARQHYTLALETWPHHPANLQFYLTAGFVPGPLVFVLEKETNGGTAPFTGLRLSEQADRSDILRQLSAVAGALHSGLDYTAPIRTTLECGLGEALLWGAASHPEALAIVHTAAQHQGPPPEWADVQLLMARPGSEGSLDEWLRQLEGVAFRSGRTRLRVSLSGVHRAALQELVLRRGYRVVKVRLRMVCRELAVAPEAVDFVSYAI
jgi:GNAT superfamily N-acetyltransferase